MIDGSGVKAPSYTLRVETVDDRSFEFLLYEEDQYRFLVQQDCSEWNYRLIEECDVN